MADQSTEYKSSSKALIGAGLAVAGVAAGFLLTRRSADVHDDGVNASDAPDYVFRRKTSRYDQGLVGRTVTINKPKDEIYRAWRDFARFPTFMENVESVEDLGDGRSKWTIKAPLGSSVELVTRITGPARLSHGRASRSRRSRRKDASNCSMSRRTAAPPSG